jgi:hypothetical protein
MNSKLIFTPVFGMMALVLTVGALTLRERMRQFKAQRLHPQKVPTRSEFSVAIKDTRCADNFMNLFEVPVMFYVACIGLYVTQTVTVMSLVVAWGYVLSRCAHSFVQTGRNHVMTRFKLFMVSNAVLTLLWTLWAVAMVGF